MPHNSYCVNGNTHYGGRLCAVCAETTFMCDKGLVHVGGAPCRKCLTKAVDPVINETSKGKPLDNGTRVVHVNDESYDIYIGREFRQHGHNFDASIWGNVKHLPQDEYEAYVRSSPFLMSRLHTLKGKTLGCWHRAPRKDCHGDVLLKLVNELCQ